MTTQDAGYVVAVATATVFIIFIAWPVFHTMKTRTRPNITVYDVPRSDRAEVIRRSVVAKEIAPKQVELRLLTNVKWWL